MSKKKLDFSALDLRKFDLTRKYDDDFSPADGIQPAQHLLLYIVSAALLLFIIWANIATLDEVARGPAKVIPASEVQVIQSLEGGIIDAVPVKEGDEVKEGQVVLRMRNVQAGADFAATTQRYLSLLAMTARLEAEAEGSAEVVFPEELLQGAPELAKAQGESFAANKKNNDEQLGILREQLSQRQQQVVELQRRISDSAGVLALSRKERDMVAPMVEKGSSSKRDLLQIERQIAQLDTEYNALKLSLPRTQDGVKEIQKRIDELTSGFSAAARKELAERQADLNTARQALAAYRDKSERNDIKSPVRGAVKDIRIKTIGGVAKPGETIMEIVPLGDQLLVEGRIKPSDIAFVTVGEKAVVRLTAFDSSIFGALDGTVVDVSPDSIADEKGESYYRVRVKTDKTGLARGGKDYAIIPGMQATIDIVTGDKTVMTYLLKPFIKASRTALRER